MWGLFDIILKISLKKKQTVFMFKLKTMENIRILSFYLCLTFLDVAHPLLITGQEGEPTFLEGRSHGYHGKVKHFYYNLT